MNPPTANFFGKTSLEVSSAPISQMSEDPSAAYVRTYSSASESSVYTRTYSNASESSVFSPSSSMESKQFKRAFGRESTDSNPVLESQSSGYLDDTYPDGSSTHMQQRSRNSSSLSDSGQASAVPPSGMPQREPSGILFTAPEHTNGSGDFPSGEFT